MDEEKITTDQSTELNDLSPALEEQAAQAPTTETKKKDKETLLQAIKYACCTASAGVIEFSTFALFKEVLPIDPLKGIDFITHMQLLTFVSTLISLALSILWNFTLNRKFTFKAAGNVPRAMGLAFLFYVPFFPFKLWFNGFMPMYLVAGAAAKAGIAPIEYLAAHGFATYACEVVSMLLNGVLEFMWQKFVIYRKTANTIAKKEA